MGWRAQLNPQAEIGRETRWSGREGPVGLGGPGGQNEGSKVVFSLGCMLESSGELLTSTDAWVPPPEMLIQLVWGTAWVPGESQTPQEISTCSQDSGRCKEAFPVVGGWARGRGDRGQVWGHGPKYHHTPPPHLEADSVFIALAF